MHLNTSILKFFLLPLGLAAMYCQAQTAGGESRTVQSQASFEAAFQTISTSPPYVLITAVDDKSGQARTFCTTSNFVLGAIHKEYGFGYDQDGMLKAMAFARGNKDHVFHFKQQQALDNMPVRYTESELVAAREWLAPLSAQELSARFGSLRKPGLPIDRYNRDAIACVLIERGLSPLQADISGQVFVAHSDTSSTQ